MRDSIGNKIEKDSLIQWQIPESSARGWCFRCMKSPMAGLRSGEEPQLPDVYVLPNPATQQALEELMARKKN